MGIVYEEYLFYFIGLSGLTGQRIANLVMDMEAKGEKVMIPTQQVSEPNMDKSKINEGK